MSADEGEGAPRAGVTRRQFLAYSGLGTLLVTAGDALRLGADAQIVFPPPPASLTRIARRRNDFLSLQFAFHNLRLDDSNPKRLVKLAVNYPAFIVVTFPPQHLADETALLENLRPVGDVRTRLAAPTRLAFDWPDLLIGVPFNLTALLNWLTFNPRLVSTAANGVDDPAGLVEPASHQTAIEIPWRLLLSPRTDSAWAHATGPVVHNGRTELWHSRLATRTADNKVDEADASKRTVRAVWTRDPAPPDPPDPEFTLTPDNRRKIVLRSTTGPGRRPVDVNRLMLSSLGGWLDCRGAWEDSGDLSLIEWIHRATMGRDSYVKTVDTGFLMPFGHKAVRVEIDERQFKTVGGTLGAYLVKRSFVVVRQPLKEYGDGKALKQANDGRAIPFRSVRITTLVTPDLDDPAEGETVQFEVPVTEVGKKLVLFDCIGTDWDRQAVEFNMPMVFVAKDYAYDHTGELVTKFHSALDEDLRRRPLHGAHVAFAKPTKQGDTSYPVEDVLFDVETVVVGANETVAGVRAALAAAGQAPFYPLVKDAHVRLPAVAQTSGASAGDLVKVEIAKAFVTNGLGTAANAGELILTLPDVKDLTFGSPEKVGGLATPNLGITGLSRALGPVGGALDKLAAGTFDPKDFFDLSAKLLGSLSLGDILEGGQLLEKGPKITTTLDVEDPAEPKAVTKLEWEPDLKPDPLHIFQPTDEAEFSLEAKIETNLLHPSDSTFEVEGKLKDVELHLIGDDHEFLVIELKEVKFTAAKDKKPEVHPEFGEIHFGGPLKFVEEFRNFLSSLGKGYSIDVSPAGIDASLSLPLPSISVGVFTLQNISIEVGAKLPFTGKAARVRFGFCSRENPFILSVAMFGGGGFFGIEVGTDRSVMLELSLEFGAAVAFDIGVASGGAEIMAGIYIKVENDDALLSGFLRAAGELSILGLIRISCEIYLGFEYHSADHKCIGRAHFYLEIELFGFITIPVKAEVERKFGGQGDPTFAQMMGPADWIEYCNAYAPLGAP